MLLEDITVVDLYPNLASSYASRLFSDLGATVIMLEPASGSDVRHMEPKFDADDESVYHSYLNQNKQSIVVDLADTETIIDILQTADILIEPLGQKKLAEYGLAYEQIKDTLPSLVYASQSPYGNSGPNQDRVSSEIVDYATGGFLYYGGDPDREPLAVHGYQSSWHGGMHVATAALFAHIYSQRTGIGQHVDVSNQEALLSAHVWLISSWLEEGEVFTRKGSDLIQCKDGYVVWGRRELPIFLLIERPELMDEPKFHTDTGWRDAQPEVRDMLEQWCLNKTKDEICTLAQQLRIKMTPVNAPQDLLDSEQFAARDWWKTITTTAGHTIQIPTPPWKLTGEQLAPLQPAPALNQHEPLTAKQQVKRTNAWSTLSAEKPLAGIRVLEMTQAWAGPLAGRHLADMGAEVITVTSPIADNIRNWHFPGGSDQIWPHFYNRGGGFNQLNRNKYNLALNVKPPAGRKQILDLIKNVDIFLENNSPRVMPNFQLDYETLKEVNPKLVMCSISGFGATGPHAHYVAVGSNIEASGGLVAQTGYDQDNLTGTGTYIADPITGSLSSLVMSAALLDAVASGEGRLIDISLQESLTTFMIDNVLHYQTTGNTLPPRVNRSLTAAPQGVYQCAGRDSWLALTIDDDNQWKLFADLIGQPDLASKYPTVQDRKTNMETIDAVIQQWTKTLDHHQATGMLQELGIPSGPVLANWEIAADPHLYYRDFWMEGIHPEVGYQRWEGAPWKFSATPATMERSAPMYGEHNDELLQEFAKRTTDEIEKLRAENVVLDEPSNKLVFFDPSRDEN